MPDEKKTVLIYAADTQTAGVIEFAARQFDLMPVKAGSPSQVQQQLQDALPLMAFVDLRLPLPDMPAEITVVPIADRKTPGDDFLTEARYCRMLHKPVAVSDVAAVIKNILDPGVVRRKDYIYHMLRAGMLLRHLQHLITGIAADDGLQVGMQEGIYEFCVGTCPHAVSGDEKTGGDAKNYHLLTVSVQHGTRQCAFYETCKLHRFADWLQKEHAALFNKRPCEAMPQAGESVRPETMSDMLGRLIEQQTAAIAQLYEVKKNFCTSCCDVVRNGTDFKEGDVLISEWADMFRNQCVYCPQPDCPLNRFFELLVYRLKTV